MIDLFTVCFVVMSAVVIVRDNFYAVCFVIVEPCVQMFYYWRSCHNVCKANVIGVLISMLQIVWEGYEVVIDISNFVWCEDLLIIWRIVDFLYCYLFNELMNWGEIINYVIKYLQLDLITENYHYSAFEVFL